MSAVWWLLKLMWRAGTRVRRAFGPATFSTSDWSSTTERYYVDNDLDEVRSLVTSYDQTFCGRCGAGPENVGRRCPACLQRLAKVLGELHGDEPTKLAELARLAREGKL